MSSDISMKSHWVEYKKAHQTHHRLIFQCFFLFFLPAVTQKATYFSFSDLKKKKISVTFWLDERIWMGCLSFFFSCQSENQADQCLHKISTKFDSGIYFVNISK